MESKFKKYELPEEPKTYEEAVKILKNIPSDAIFQEAERKSKLKIGVITGAAALFGAISGLSASDPLLGFSAFGFAAMFNAPFLGLLADIKKRKNSFESGDYFRYNNPDKIMSDAKEYIKIYKHYLENREKKEGKQL